MTATSWFRSAAKLSVSGKTFGDMRSAGLFLAVAARKGHNYPGLASIQPWFRNPDLFETLAAEAPPPTKANWNPGADGTRVLATNAMAAVGSETAEPNWLWDLLHGACAELGQMARAAISEAGGVAVAAKVLVGGVVAGLLFIPRATGGVVTGSLPDGGSYQWDGAAGTLTLTTPDGVHFAGTLDRGILVGSNDHPIGRIVDGTIIIDQQLLNNAIAADIRGDGRTIGDDIFFQKPPKDAKDPNGAKAPGKPGEAEGFRDPKGGEQWVPNPYPGMGGSSHGWLDDKGQVWCPTGKGGRAHGGPHWDVQRPGKRNINVYPGKNIDDLEGDGK